MKGNVPYRATPALRRQLLDGTDLVVSPICYGAAAFGEALRGRELDVCIRTYRDAGGNFFDTAHCYSFWLPAGAGSSERALGEYIRRNGKGDLVIGTKGGHPPAHDYPRSDHWLAPSQIDADIDDSLARLGLETLDLYWLHRDDTRETVGEIIETLNAQMRRGRIRHIGASNWRTIRIAEANRYASAHGLRGFVASQPEWNLAYKNQRNPDPQTEQSHGAAMLFLEEPDVAWHQRSRLPVIPYSATAGGYFATCGQRAAAAYDNDITRARLACAQKIAKALGVATGQIALAWLLNQTFQVIPIIGATNLEHLREDLHAGSLHLDAQQIAALPDHGTISHVGDKDEQNRGTT